MQRGQKRRPREHKQDIETDDPLDGLEDDTEESNTKHDAHDCSQQEGLCIIEELPVIDLPDKGSNIGSNHSSEQVIEQKQILSDQGREMDEQHCQDDSGNELTYRHPQRS